LSPSSDDLISNQLNQSRPLHWRRQRRAREPFCVLVFFGSGTDFFAFRLHSSAGSFSILLIDDTFYCCRKRNRPDPIN
jgi:hypothetical protein